MSKEKNPKNQDSLAAGIDPKPSQPVASQDVAEKDLAPSNDVADLSENPQANAQVGEAESAVINDEPPADQPAAEQIAARSTVSYAETLMSAASAAGTPAVDALAAADNVLVTKEHLAAANAERTNVENEQSGPSSAE